MNKKWYQSPWLYVVWGLLVLTVAVAVFIAPFGIAILYGASIPTAVGVELAAFFVALILGFCHLIGEAWVGTQR